MDKLKGSWTGMSISGTGVRRLCTRVGQFIAGVQLTRRFSAITRHLPAPIVINCRRHFTITAARIESFAVKVLEYWYSTDTEMNHHATESVGQYSMALFCLLNLTFLAFFTAVTLSLTR